MKISYVTAFAVLLGLSYVGTANAQIGQGVAAYVKADFAIVNAYGNDLTAGRATDAEQAACQKSLSNLTGFVLAHAAEDPFAPTAQNDAILDEAIVKNLLKVDTNPCPTIAAFSANGKAAFTAIDPSMARTLDPYMQEEIAMHSVMTSVASYGNLRASGQANGQNAQLCQSNFNRMNGFIANAESEQAAGNAPPADIALYNEIKPMMPRFGAYPCN